MVDLLKGRDNIDAFEWIVDLLEDINNIVSHWSSGKVELCEFLFDINDFIWVVDFVKGVFDVEALEWIVDFVEGV